MKNKIGKISEMMINDHCKIEGLLKSFKISYNKKSKSKIDSFNKLKMELDRHFFIEERVIFTSYNPEGWEEHRILQNILKEHIAILRMLGGIESQLNNGHKPNIQAFENSLLKHKDLEDRVLYPKMDQELDQDSRNLIVQRIKNQKF